MAFHKCNWQILVFTAVGGYVLYRSRTKFQDREIYLRNHKGLRSKIEYKAHTAANKGLGVMLCPTGDQKAEFARRLQQTRESVALIAASSLNITETYLTLKTRVLPKITYSFPITSFTVRQLKALAVLIDNAFIPKLGVSSKMKRIAMYAPLELGGANFPSIESLQDQMGIDHFVRSVQWGKELATDIRIVLSRVQLYSGLCTPFLEDCSIKLRHMEDGWLLHLRQRLAHLNGSIWVEEAWTPKLQRVGDSSIMEALTNLPDVTTGELIAANNWRMYLRVITLSDIVTLDGRMIDKGLIDGSTRTDSQLRWPMQPKPTARMLDTFRRLLKRAFSTNRHLPSRQNISLATPLGEWLPVERHIKYMMYRTANKLYLREYVEDFEAPPQVDPNGDIMLAPQLDTGILWQFSEHSTGNYYLRERTVTTIPPQAHPVSGYFQDERFYASLDYAMQPPPLNPPTQFSPTIVGESVLRNSQRLTVVSDGSMDPISGQAAFAWVITQQDRSGYIKRSKPICTNPKYMSSFRSELEGVHDVISYLVTNHYTGRKIDLWCDNKWCIDALNKSGNSLDELGKAEGAILKATRHLLTEFVDITLHHIYGHQDDNNSYENLDFESQLNVDCDGEAKRQMRASSVSSRTEAEPGTGAMLYLGDDMITSHMAEQIQYAGQAPKMFQYIRERFEWTDHQCCSVNEKGIGAAKKRLTRPVSNRTTQMMYGWLNVGHQKIKFDQDGTCPCCGLHEEDQLHLYRCENVLMRETLRQGIQDMERKLYKVGMASPVYLGFIDAICKLAHLPRKPYALHCSHTLRAIERQESLGSDALLRGFHHVEWAYTLQSTWIPPRRYDDGTMEKKRDPFELSTVLIGETWKLFEGQWKMRNTILHSPDSFLLASEMTQLDRRFVEYKRNKIQLLAYQDHYLIDIPEREFVKWERDKKKKLLRLLETCKAAFIRECEARTDRQSLITTFFRRIDPT
jgi:hypothetical protein